VLFLLNEWERTGRLEASRLSSQSVNSINQAVNAISQAVPGAAPAKLALDTALAVGSLLASISDELIARKVIVRGVEAFQGGFL
jgi:hypothetical protein